MLIRTVRSGILGAYCFPCRCNGGQHKNSGSNFVAAAHKSDTLEGIPWFNEVLSRFVKNYGVLAAPLTNLLRKNCFKWSHDATIAFEELKKTLTTTPILTLPYFSQPFIVECDSSDMGIGAILQQDVRPISFYSHTLA